MNVLLHSLQVAGSDDDFLLIKPAVLQVPVDLRVALMINEILLLTYQRDIK
jgi:hypothetical protein